MTITRSRLHDLVDMIDLSDANKIYSLLFRFIPEDYPLPDEIEAIRAGQEEIKRGEFVLFDEVDWN